MKIQEAKANEFEDVPDGKYIVSIEKMEIKLTKKGDKLMFAAQFKIKEGEHKNRMIFFNRTISGSTSEKWTDAMAIKSIITWLDKLETEVEPEFINYEDFGRIIDLIFAKTGRKLFKIGYHSYLFNPVEMFGRAS